jgi:Protein of unknown function (DUF1036)
VSGLFISNQYDKEINVAIAWPDSNCHGPLPFKKSGWSNVKPGSIKKVLDIDLSGIEVAYCAFATDGRVWDGDAEGQLPTTIPDDLSAFGPECLDKQEKASVNFRLIKLLEPEKTVVLNKDN